MLPKRSIERTKNSALYNNALRINFKIFHSSAAPPKTTFNRYERLLRTCVNLSSSLMLNEGTYLIVDFAIT